MKQRSTARKHKAKRGPYRGDQSSAIADIELRRARGGFTHEQLVGLTDGVSLRTWGRMRDTGRAFSRHVRALKHALRKLETEARQASTQFREFDE